MSSAPWLSLLENLETESSRRTEVMAFGIRLSRILENAEELCKEGTYTRHQDDIEDPVSPEQLAMDLKALYLEFKSNAEKWSK